MVLNQDGSIQVQTGETEIGQGCDTAYAQMAADAVGIPFEDVHIVSTQDTDVTPFGLGAYASRQTYIGGFSIQQTGQMLKERILSYAVELTRQPRANLDLIDGKIVRVSDGRELMTLGELATEALYSLEHSQHITAESTYQIKNNAYSFGCTFAEVEVDIPMCKVKLLDIVNVHDCGTLINPALAEAQVHGGMSHGHRLRPERGAEVRPQDRPAPEQQPPGLQALHLHGPPPSAGGVRGEPGAHLALRDQGPGGAAGL